VAQDILSRGAGLGIVWPLLLALALIGPILLAVALARFRKTIGTMV
jgi:ABC-2 type transport system permease protein